MKLPPAIPKKPKRSGRWKSQAHMNFVRSRACSMCGTYGGIEAAHVRNGSDAGMGRKPDDFRAVSLCGGPDGCHARQHQIGEKSFWKGVDIEALIRAFQEASPKAWEIRKILRERGNG